MSLDVDAVNERLNGLVTLLQAVGVDTVDQGEADRLSRSFKGGLPDARQLDDDQIDAIIKKLQQAQAEAPQIIAALEAHAEARSLTGGSHARAPSKATATTEPDEDEDDDEFDEDANYPMVGAGCSDDISVVSDLTTPTVLTGVPVPEEEHYRDTLPPMIIGGGGAPAMRVAATKKKNMLSQVRPSAGMMAGPRGGASRSSRLASPRGGGAAAARKQKYQNTMARIQQEQPPPPMQNPRRPARTSRKSSNSSTDGDRPRPSRRRQSIATSGRSHDHDQGDFYGSSQQTDWNAFENKPRSSRRDPTVIDDDGFLVGDSFDPFAAGPSNNPFRSSAGELAFSSAPRDPFSSNASASGFENYERGNGNPRKTRPKKPLKVIHDGRYPSSNIMEVKVVGSLGLNLGFSLRRAGLALRTSLTRNSL